MQVEVRPIKTIKTAKYNPRQISDQALDSLKQSIERFGFVDPVIVNDRTGTLVGGHQRIKAAKALGLKDVPVVGVNLDEAEEKALNVALNKISGEWDLDLLRGVLEDVVAEGLDISLTGFSEDEWQAIQSGAGLDAEGSIVSDLYTAKVQSPIYEVTGKCPPVAELYDQQRTESLKAAIEGAKLQKDVRQFLLAAAERHTIFNYSKIAEFYAHATPEVQDLMEQSALIIIDYNQAVELGFVKLTEKFAAQFVEEYGDE